MKETQYSKFIIHNSKKGFTLIELLVVISIIGILSALIMSNFNSVRQRTRDAQRKSDLNQVKAALGMYHNDNNLYPLTANFPSWGTVFNNPDNTSMVYMKILPNDPAMDPVSGTPKYSYASANGTDYCLKATLENGSDSSIATSHARCSTSCNFGSAANVYAVCPD